MEELQNGKDEFLLQTGPYRFYLPKVRTYARKNKKKVEKSDVKNYTSDQFEKILQRIVADNGQGWRADLVENASENCLRAAKEEIETIASLGSAVHFVGKASELRSQILSALSKHEKNTFTGKEIGKNV